MKRSLSQGAATLALGLLTTLAPLGMAHGQELAARSAGQDQPLLAQAASMGGSDAPFTGHPETSSSLLEPPGKPGARLSWLKSSMQLGSVSVPTPTLVLVGAGAVAGSVGGIFGLQSRSQLQASRDAIFRDEMVARHGEAVSSARTANILFGTAVVLGTSALVTWLLSSGAEPARVEVAR